MAGRDRLRELLDAVLDEANPRLDDMAADAFASSFHFNREVSRGAGESPVALRRRVMLERAAWRIAGGTSVTDAAWEAGYESLEGFSRAFARSYAAPPSAFTSRGDVRAHWLDAPNGVHFHPPVNLWVHDVEETSLMHVAAQLFQHDLEDTDHLIEVVAGIPDQDYRREVLPTQSVLSWDGLEPSAATVLDHHVWSKEVWTASFAGADFPEKGADDPASLKARHEAIAPRWLEVVRDVERRNAWDDRLIDALCDPPESFQVGSVLSHVLTFGAHRRQLVRLMLRASGHEQDHGDPIDWLRRRNEK